MASQDSCWQARAAVLMPKAKAKTEPATEAKPQMRRCLSPTGRDEMAWGIILRLLSSGHALLSLLAGAGGEEKWKVAISSRQRHRHRRRRVCLFASNALLTQKNFHTASCQPTVRFPGFWFWLFSWRWNSWMQPQCGSGTAASVLLQVRPHSRTVHRPFVGRASRIFVCHRSWSAIGNRNRFSIWSWRLLYNGYSSRADLCLWHRETNAGRQPR